MRCFAPGAGEKSRAKDGAINGDRFRSQRVRSREDAFADAAFLLSPPPLRQRVLPAIYHAKKNKWRNGP